MRIPQYTFKHAVYLIWKIHIKNIVKKILQCKHNILISNDIQTEQLYNNKNNPYPKKALKSYDYEPWKNIF